MVICKCFVFVEVTPSPRNVSSGARFLRGLDQVVDVDVEVIIKFDEVH